MHDHVIRNPRIRYGVPNGYKARIGTPRAGDGGFCMSAWPGSVLSLPLKGPVAR